MAEGDFVLLSASCVAHSLQNDNKNGERGKTTDYGALYSVIFNSNSGNYNRSTRGQKVIYKYYNLSEQVLIFKNMLLKTISRKGSFNKNYLIKIQFIRIYLDYRHHFKIFKDKIF